MTPGERNLIITGLWLSSGQLIITTLALILDVWRFLMSEQKPTQPGKSVYKRLISAYLSLFIVLAVSALVIYWISILITTASKGTVSELVTRAAAWATFFGLGAGIFIGQWITKKTTNPVKDETGAS